MRLICNIITIFALKIRTELPSARGPCDKNILSETNHRMKLGTIVRLIVPLTVAAFLLSGCGAGEKKYRIGVSQCSDDDWRARMNQEIEREAMFHDNAEVEIRSADDSNAKQIEDIRYFADNGFDIIIAAPNEAAPITPVIDEVMARGIPVVIFDRSVKGDNFTAFQGADNDSIGLQAAAYVRSVKAPGSTYIEISGNPGSTPAQGRHRGFTAGASGLKLLGTGTGNWNYDEALVAADSLLALYPGADVVFAHNDRMALAASDAAARRGLDPMIIGIDAAPEIGMKAVAEGKIDATFIYPTEGYALMQTALAILEGRPYRRVTRLPAASAVDASNADILMLQNESLKEETSKMQNLKSQVDIYWSRHSMQTIFLYVVLGILSLLFVALFLLIRMYWQKQRQQRQLVRQQEQLVAQNEELERQRDNEQELNRQLNEATQSKLMFFTNVSHDLRTPLTLIAEPVRQFAHASNLTPAQSSMARIADRNVRILRRLINQVLDFRKYENGKLDLHPTEVGLRRLLEDWTGAFQAVARQRSIDLFIDGSILDIFVNDKWAQSIRVFPQDGTATDVSVFSDGTTRVRSLEAWTLTGEGAGIDCVTADDDESTSADVFHISGRLLKKGVMREDALEGLDSGIYIIDGRKYVVK